MDYSGSLLRTFLKLLEVLNKSDLKYCVVGGMAVSILVRPRTTQDIDFLIDATEEELDSLVDNLKREFSLVDFKQIPIPSRKAPVWRAVLCVPDHEEGLIIVDFLTTETAQQEETLKRATAVPVGGVNIPLATIEDLLLMKTTAGRPMDLEDIKAIRELRGDDLDEDYLSKWSSEF